MNTELIELAEQFMPYIDLITPRYRQLVLDYVLQGGTTKQSVVDTLGWAAATVKAVPNPLEDALYSFRWAAYFDQSTLDPPSNIVNYATHVAESHASLEQFILTQT